MKRKVYSLQFSVLLVFMFVAVPLYAQDARTLVVTSEDVQIKFFEDPTEQWRAVELVSVTYSTEPLGVHEPMVRIGQQIWEGLLQEDKPELGKAVIVINIVSLPAPNMRGVEFHFRTREIDTDPFISDWSESNTVRIFGKPGKPVQTK